MSDGATMTGRVAGNYRILEKLGEGGMGAVYRAVDSMVERQVAIKVLKPEIANNAEVLERFRTEAVTLARLNHPAIATLYSFFRQDDEYFMVMEYVPGRTLDEVIRTGGAMPWRAATDLLIELLGALQHAHFLGILHRDIKPSNIMITPARSIKVTDFGIARALGTARLTREGRMVGTLEYLAPERVMGKTFDERSDLYSAGVVFYEMLTGRVPFESESDYALIRAQVEQVPPPLEQFGVSVPLPLVDVLMKSLAKDPENRYSTAGSLAAALRDAKIRAEAETPAIKETRLAPQEEPRREMKATEYAVSPAAVTANTPRAKVNRLGLLAAAALILVLGVGFSMYRRSAEAKEAERLVQSRAREAAAEQAQIVSAQPPVSPAPPQPVIIPPPEEAQPQLPARNQPPAQPRRRQPASPVPAGSSSLPVATSPVATNPVGTNPTPVQSSPNPAVDPPPAVAAAPPVLPADPVKVEREIPAPAVVASIHEIQKLFVEKMPEGLDDFIRDEIRSQLKYRIELVGSPERADAIMRCDVEHEEGGHKVTNATAHVFGTKGHESAIVRVYDRSGRRLLWEEEVTDKRGVIGIHGGEGKLAGRIVGKFKKQLR